MQPTALTDLATVTCARRRLPAPRVEPGGGCVVQAPPFLLRLSPHLADEGAVVLRAEVGRIAAAGLEAGDRLLAATPGPHGVSVTADARGTVWLTQHLPRARLCAQGLDAALDAFLGRAWRWRDQLRDPAFAAA